MPSPHLVGHHQKSGRNLQWASVMIFRAPYLCSANTQAKKEASKKILSCIKLVQDWGESFVLLLVIEEIMEQIAALKSVSKICIKSIKKANKGHIKCKISKVEYEITKPESWGVPCQCTISKLRKTAGVSCQWMYFFSRISWQRKSDC